MAARSLGERPGLARALVLTVRRKACQDYSALIASQRWQRAINAGAAPGEFCRAGIDLAALAYGFQDDGAALFVKSWHEVPRKITSKSGLIRAV